MLSMGYNVLHTDTQIRAHRHTVRESDHTNQEIKAGNQTMQRGAGYRSGYVYISGAHTHRAIGLLTVFEEGNHDTWHGNGSGVERMCVRRLSCVAP